MRLDETRRRLTLRMLDQARGRLRGQDGGEEGFALIFTLLLIFIVASLSIAVAGIVYNQSRPTQFQRKDIATINAATAGLQVSLDQIRAASKTDSSGQLVGVLASLRCSGSSGSTFYDNSGAMVTAPGATFAGTVNTTTGNVASAGTLRFTTSVSYYGVDPSHQTLGWLSSNALACPLTSVPTYAYLQTHGNVAGEKTVSGDRTQHATYRFSTTNLNVLGGRLIPLGSTPAQCLDAGASANVNTTPTMQPCLAVGSATQSWSYRNDLTLFYQGAPALNLCIQATTIVGDKATLQKCTGTGSGSTYPYAAGQQVQEWPFNDTGHFAAASATGGVSATCLDPAGQTSTTQAPAGANLVVVACDGVTFGLNAWNPDPQVGAGRAGGNTTGLPGAPTNQYVNYAEFGRCLDILGQNVNADHLIDYPCKQAPDSSQLAFNQVWSYTASGSTGYGTFSVFTGGVLYCLTAPSAGVYITTKSGGASNCTTSPTSYQLWQPTGTVAGNYGSSDELVNQQLGLCMSASSAPNGNLTLGSSNIIVEACNGTLRQKWNAPPTTPGTGLGNISEDTGGQTNPTPAP